MKFLSLFPISFWFKLTKLSKTEQLSMTETFMFFFFLFLRLFSKFFSFLYLRLPWSFLSRNCIFLVLYLWVSVSLSQVRLTMTVFYFPLFLVMRHIQLSGLLLWKGKCLQISVEYREAERLYRHIFIVVLWGWSFSSLCFCITSAVHLYSMLQQCLLIIAGIL